MPSVCFYFQVHQPYRLKKYSYFHAGRDHEYVDDVRNRQILRKVAEKCYLPANKKMLELIRRFDGKFRVAYSISGTALEQMREYSPESLKSFQELAKTGCVEFLAETAYHTLASVCDVKEFKSQVELHGTMMQELFGQQPKVFRNTELIYDDSIGKMAAEMGYSAVLAEGADDVLGWRSPNFTYSVPGTSTKILLKNYRLSDDIAFRFSNRQWECYPLTADKFGTWVHRVSACGDTVNLFIDYETFGEHQWASTGIFDFLDHLPEQVLRKAEWSFKTPSETIAEYPARSELSFSRLTSWADKDRDISAWRGNRMQESALKQIYELAEAVHWTNDNEVIDLWRKLQTTDHFYYMCTKWFADGDVHAYFSPFESPYEAFINYMNVLRDFREHYLGVDGPQSRRSVKGETVAIAA